LFLTLPAHALLNRMFIQSMGT